MNPYHLYLVTDDQQDIETLKFVVEEAVQGGVTAVQVREKHNNLQRFIRRAEAVKQILAGSGVPLIINDRVDVALVVGADGVHLGQSDMPVQLARRLVGDKMLIGLSVENLYQLEESKGLPIDYIGLSAIFPTPTKADTKKHWGIKGLEFALGESKHPIVAIGGINETNIRDIARTKVDGIALVSAISHSREPKRASERLLQLMRE